MSENKKNTIAEKASSDEQYGAFSFGELLAVKLFKIYKDDLSLKTTFYRQESPGKLKKTEDCSPISEILKLLAIDFPSDITNIESEVEISAIEYKHENYGANKLHKIDMSLESANCFLPVECKFGNTGGAKSFPKSFESNWLSDPRAIEPEKNKKTDALKIAKGTMINLLDVADKITIRKAKVNNGWGLIIRRNALSTDLEEEIETEFENLKVIFILENLVNGIGDKKTKVQEELNSLFETQLSKLFKSQKPS